MSSTRNPYRELLGWQAERAPNYYELLGLPPLADVDRQAVNQAAERVAARLRQQPANHDAELCSRLLAEVEIARKCLCDPQRKAQYDKALRRGEQQGTKAAGTAAPTASGVASVRAPRPAGPSESDLLPPGAVEPAAPGPSPKTTKKPLVAAVPTAARPAASGPAGARTGTRPAKAAASSPVRAEAGGAKGGASSLAVELPPGLSVELPPGLTTEPVGGVPAAEVVPGTPVPTGWQSAPAAYQPQVPAHASPMPAAAPVALSTAPSATVLAAKRQREMRRALTLFGLGMTVVVVGLGGVVYWITTHSTRGSMVALGPDGSSSPSGTTGATSSSASNTLPSSVGDSNAAGDDAPDLDAAGSPGNVRRGKRRAKRGGGSDLIVSPQEGTPSQPGSGTNEVGGSSANTVVGGVPGPSGASAGPSAGVGASMPAQGVPSTPAGSSAAGSMPSSPPAMPTSGTESRPVPMEPPAPPLTRAEVEKLIKAMEGARVALAEHQFSAVDAQLAEADRLAKTQEHKQAVARVRRLADLLAAFQQTLVTQLQSMQGGETFKVGTSTQVTLVEANESRVVVRMAGMNRSFPLSELPPGLALAIVDLRFRQGDPAGLQAKAAFLIAQKRPTDDTRQKARSLLEEAQAAGADVSDLMRLLEENYADWLKDLPANTTP